MSFDVSSMGRGDLCHDWRMSLLLADPMQDTGAAKPNARGAGLTSGFGDCGIGDSYLKRR